MAIKMLANTPSKKALGPGNPLRKRLYTLKEGAEYLGRSEWGMRELIWAGVIPVVKPRTARKIFLDVQDLDRFVEANKSIYR
ncbi:MAG: helix-turn-helix domain-containing protein [Proteobacteria bacterium]|nr:helix-turn-helix domain-containing protein [Pseudomonadota bacterium]MBU2260910.1 helix-turn-helix domain-containing protein [Pseudomonadota bacterium]